MTIATDAFDAVRAAIPVAQCTVRVGRAEIEGLCPGLGINRESTDRGQYGDVESNVRVKTDEEPDGEIKNGTAIEIKMSGSEDWIKARVGGRFAIGGMTRLVLEAVHG